MFSVRLTGLFELALGEGRSNRAALRSEDLRANRLHALELPARRGRIPDW